jgi:ubiquinone/menaquinone biosynthesis C-methylase UbiE
MYIRFLEGTRVLLSWKAKRKVMKRYDLTAEMYEERYAEEQRVKYRKALENFDVAALAVLDVGCGSGLFLSYVADRVEFFVGVDVSRKLLLGAKVRSVDFKNASVLQADADHLPFKEGVFGGVFAFTLLQNMPQPYETLSELGRVAISGGRIIASGLKKAFGIDGFMDVIKSSGLDLVSFLDDKLINCYIALLAT